MSPAAAPVIAPLDPQTPQALHLLACSDAYLGALYPAESNHLESADSLARPNVHFVGVWLDGRLAGCFSLKLFYFHFQARTNAYVAITNFNSFLQGGLIYMLTLNSRYGGLEYE